MSDVVAHVADPSGLILAEIEPELSPVSWILNGVGGTTAALSTQDTKWREPFFLLGGMLLLEFSNGLPNWVGISTGNQRVRWSGRRGIVSYQSAERYLVRRKSGKNVSLENQTVGEIVRGLLDAMNGKRQSPLRAGELWTDSAPYAREYHYTKLFAAITQLQKDSGGDWDVSGKRGTALNSHRIDLALNFRARRGSDRPQVALIEDHNATVVEYTEQDGGLVNDWTVVGAGNDWGLLRPEGVADDADSIATYDLWEDAMVENNVIARDTLTAMAQARLAASLRPFRVLTLDCVDLKPGLFAMYDVGDRVSVLSHTAGWHGLDEMGRVTARTYDPVTRRCRVVLEMDQHAAISAGGK